jgi:hypothetical protein
MPKTFSSLIVSTEMVDISLYVISLHTATSLSGGNLKRSKVLRIYFTKHLNDLTNCSLALD